MTELIAVIPGDGIGPEVVAEATRIIDLVHPGLEFENYSLGAAHWLATGEVLSDETMARLAQADAILLGAVGVDPRSAAIPSGLMERGLLLKLRFGFDHAVNLRPSKLYTGVTTPLSLAVVADKLVDFVIVREGTEGLYCGNGGVVRAGTEHQIATEVSVNTFHGVARVVRYAFELANRRRRHLTLVHKHNVLVHAGGLWQRVVDEVKTEYADVATDYMHVDAATIALITRPDYFDVIVTDNLFGDILTDEAAAVTGGIGLAASANLNLSGEYPSMFEPVHGSAPDIAGKGIADPRAAILSGAMMLDHMGYTADAERIRNSVESDIIATIGQVRTTAQIGNAIAARI